MFVNDVILFIIDGKQLRNSIRQLSPFYTTFFM